jgi:Na+-translocating ferredoxin:NAD+ oxidoreductase RnfD subunit
LAVDKGLRKFFRTPKGLLTIVLMVLTALAAPVEGLRIVGPELLGAVGVAAAIDLLILRWRNGAWEFPSGAVLTGLIVAMVLAPREPWHVSAITSAIAVVSKYIVRTRSANVFNPAALGLVTTYYWFESGHSWWGALPDLPAYALVLLMAAGIFISDRVNKMPLVVMFLGLYYLFFTVMGFVSPPIRVASIFRAPDLHMVLYFVFFILTDPPTSPVKYRDQLIFAVIVAVVSVVVFQWIGAIYYLFAGVLVGNVWEAWRRVHLHRKRERARAVSRGEGLQPA